MSFVPLTFAVAALLGAPAVHAVRSQNTNQYPFPDDLLNATATVNFDAYNVTGPFSNSSEANTRWQAQLRVRSPVDPNEIVDDYDPDEADDVSVMAMTQIRLTWDVEGEDDVEEPDDSWGFCVASQRLFNITLAADQNVDSDCGNVLDRECVEWLQDYVNDGGACSGVSHFDENNLHDAIMAGPCSNSSFPEPTYSRSEEPYVPEWGRLRNMTIDNMENTLQYQSEGFEDTDDTDEFDDLVASVFVLLVSWGERTNSSNLTVEDYYLNGNVLCLRANETTEGSRTLEEIAEAKATVLGGGRMGVVSVMAAAAAGLVTFVL